MSKQVDEEKVWSDFAINIWLKKEPHWKPSEGEINYWRNFLKSLPNEKNTKILILGVTPEFRDMLVDFPVLVTMLDINEGMKKGMDLLLKSTTQNETFIKGDWLEMPLDDDSFDIVIGSMPFQNIKKTSYDRFIKQIKRVLKNDGYFLLSTWFFKDQPEVTLDEFINLYKQDPESFKNFQNRSYALCSLGKKVFHNKETWEWDWKEVDESVTKKAKEAGVPDAEIENLLMNFGDYIQVCPMEPDFSNYLSNHFEIIEKWQDDYHKVMNFKEDFILKNK